MVRIPKQLGASLSAQPAAMNDSTAWKIIEGFATTKMKLPKAENALHSHLGDKYADNEWWPALNAVMDAEEDSASALAAIKKLQLNMHLATVATEPSTTKTSTAHPPHTYTAQCQQLEADLLDSITELKK